MMDSMKGKRVVITGPTSGIGKEIALGLASLGAELLLGCRDPDKGRRTAEEISQRTGSDHVEVMQVDTSDQASIRGFAKKILSRYQRVDVLINNAGVSRGARLREKSAEGIELTLATNVLGYFLLTRELLQRLRESAPARIVNVASTFASDLDLEDLQFERRHFEGMKAYAQSKACDRLLTWAFARRLENSGVTANAMAPGLVVETGLYRDAPPEVMARLRQRGGRTPAQGAETAVWLASSPDVEEVSGKFFEQRVEIPCGFRNMATEEKLWTICESLV
jgi:NAD(P)-dependent dehydrogenase (short-subunit alcohol dehydrogenase family)